MLPDNHAGYRDRLYSQYRGSHFPVKRLPSVWIRACPLYYHVLSTVHSAQCMHELVHVDIGKGYFPWQWADSEPIHTWIRLYVICSTNCYCEILRINGIYIINPFLSNSWSQVKRFCCKQELTNAFCWACILAWVWSPVLLHRKRHRRSVDKDHELHVDLHRNASKNVHKRSLYLIIYIV